MCQYSTKPAALKCSIYFKLTKSGKANTTCTTGCQHVLNKDNIRNVDHQ